MDSSHHQRADSGAHSSEPRRSLRLRKKRIRHLNLSSLAPVRSLLHPCLTDADAARLMRVSPTTANHLLQGYTFTDHVFAPVDVKGMWRMKALYEAYDMRLTRMCLPGDVKEVALEDGSGRSPIPSSLTHLLLGPVPRYDNGIDPQSMFGLEAAGVDSVQCPWMDQSLNPSVSLDEELLMEQWSEPVFVLANTRGAFYCSLPPGLLPHGLRCLQFPYAFNSPLQVGSIPSTVKMLQFGISFNQPLSAGMLPASLVHLVLESGFNHPLTAGVLPASLRRLYMLAWDQPLAVGVLPPSLQALHLASFNHPIPPHVLPSGLTHLRLVDFNHPLSVGSLPSSLVSFDMGYQFNHPLLPHVLPSSLRVLFFSRGYGHPLTPGILPEELVVLHYRYHIVELALFSEILPSSVRVLDLGGCCGEDIPARVILPTVRRLRLAENYRERLAKLQLSAETQVTWEQD